MFTAALCVIAPNWKFKCPSPSEQLTYSDKKEIIGYLGKMDRKKQESDGITKQHEETSEG